MNTNYLDYGIEPMEITIRDKIGISINPEKIKEELKGSITALLSKDSSSGKHIEETLRKYLYYPGRSGEAGGKYILERLGTEKQR